MISETFLNAPKNCGRGGAPKLSRRFSAELLRLKPQKRRRLMAGNNARPMVLQHRDLEFFKMLGRYARVVDREQAMKFAGFNSQTRANARLLKLSANGFLRRYFLGTLKGGSKALYTLAPKGAPAAVTQNQPVIPPKESLPVGHPFVNHQPAINDVHNAAPLTLP